MKCLYSGDKPLGIVQSNAEDVAYDSNTSVKEAIDGVKVASATANQYNTIALMLTAFNTVYSSLSYERKKRAYLIRKSSAGDFKYVLTIVADGVFNINNIVFGANTLQAQRLSFLDKTWYTCNIVVGGTSTMTDNSNNSQGDAWELWA